MPEAESISRLHIRVHGRVQGVGFRAHVEYAARELGLTGWVRNVGYDRVEAVAEGPKSQLEQLEQSMRTGPLGSHVDEADAEWLDATGEFEFFVVRRSV
jgi:acylphosphatase